MKNAAALGLLILSSSPLAACDRNDQAPQDSHSGKAPTGMIEPGPDAPSRERAATAETAASAGAGGAGGGGAGGNGGSGAAVGANGGSGGRS